MHEKNVVFDNRKDVGHNHDGINSALIELGRGQVEKSNLSSDLLNYLLNQMRAVSGNSSGGSGSSGSGEDHTILMLETAPSNPIDGRQFFSTTVADQYVYDEQSGTWFEMQ